MHVEKPPLLLYLSSYSIYYIYIELMSSKPDLLKKTQITELQGQLKVEMAKNANVSDGTLPTHIGKKKP